MSNEGSNAPGRLGGVTGKGFKPGQSGNPKGSARGRAKGFASAVRAVAGEDGLKLAKAAALIAFGKAKDVNAFFGEPVKRDAKARMQAITFLADRGFGKAAETVHLVGEDGGPVAVTFGGRYRPDGTKDAPAT